MEYSLFEIYDILHNELLAIKYHRNSDKIDKWHVIETNNDRDNDIL